MDGAKDTCDVAVRPTAATWPVAHAAAEISVLVAQLGAMGRPALGVREAMGGFAGPLHNEHCWVGGVSY